MIRDRQFEFNEVGWVNQTLRLGRPSPAMGGGTTSQVAIISIAFVKTHHSCWMASILRRDARDKR